MPKSLRAKSEKIELENFNLASPAWQKWNLAPPVWLSSQWLYRQRTLWVVGRLVLHSTQLIFFKNVTGSVSTQCNEQGHLFDHLLLKKYGKFKSCDFTAHHHLRPLCFDQNTQHRVLHSVFTLCFHSGDLCVVQSVPGGCWERAVVLGWPNAKTVKVTVDILIRSAQFADNSAFFVSAYDSHVLQVYCVDSGKKRDLQKEELSQALDEFSTVPPLAVHCLLHRVVPGMARIDALAKMVLDKDVVVRMSNSTSCLLDSRCSG